MPHFMTVLIFFKPFLDNKTSIFEEYGAFKCSVIDVKCLPIFHHGANFIFISFGII